MSTEGGDESFSWFSSTSFSVAEDWNLLRISSDQQQIIIYLQHTHFYFNILWTLNTSREKRWNSLKRKWHKVTSAIKTGFTERKDKASHHQVLVWSQQSTKTAINVHSWVNHQLLLQWTWKLPSVRSWWTSSFIHSDSEPQNKAALIDGGGGCTLVQVVCGRYKWVAVRLIWITFTGMSRRTLREVFLAQAQYFYSLFSCRKEVRSRRWFQFQLSNKHEPWASKSMWIHTNLQLEKLNTVIQCRGQLLAICQYIAVGQCVLLSKPQKHTVSVHGPAAALCW